MKRTLPTRFSFVKFVFYHHDTFQISLLHWVPGQDFFKFWFKTIILGCFEVQHHITKKLLKTLATALSSESITSFVFYRFLVKTFFNQTYFRFRFHPLSKYKLHYFLKCFIIINVWDNYILKKPLLSLHYFINFTLKFCCLLYTFRSWSLFEVKIFFL